MKSITWNPWHGCHKISAGCAHCYVYRRDESISKDASVVVRTKDFYLPVRRSRDGSYKIPGGSFLDTCFTSDFFVEEADKWRAEIWEMMKIRSDLGFFFITKRIERMEKCLPSDWGDFGYPNVSVACTVENQAMADKRLPVYLKMPLRSRSIVCSPLLEKIELEKYLADDVTHLTAAGESGPEARVCDYDWVLDFISCRPERSSEKTANCTASRGRSSIPRPGKPGSITARRGSAARTTSCRFLNKTPCRPWEDLL